MTNKFEVGKEYTFKNAVEYTGELIEFTVKIVGRGEGKRNKKYVAVNFTSEHNEKRVYDLYTDFNNTEKIIIKSIGQNQLSEPFDLLATQPNADLKRLADELEDYLTFYKLAELHWLEQDNTRINAYLTTRLEQANHNAITAYGMSVLSQDLTNSVIIDGIKAAAESLRKEIKKSEVK